MIQHIVFWKLAETAAGRDKEANYRILKEKLEALNGVIPGLQELRVGRNLNGETAYDAALVSRFESLEALKAYDSHPAHMEVRAFIKQVRLDRASLDFEMEAP